MGSHSGGADTGGMTKYVISNPTQQTRLPASQSISQSKSSFYLRGTTSPLALAASPFHNPIATYPRVGLVQCRPVLTCIPIPK